MTCKPKNISLPYYIKIPHIKDCACGPVKLSAGPHAHFDFNFHSLPAPFRYGHVSESMMSSKTYCCVNHLVVPGAGSSQEPVVVAEQVCFSFSALLLVASL